MKTKPTTEQLAKLPKWAQSYIDDLERRTKTAEKSLREWTDEQTPSPFRTEECVCIGDGPPVFLMRYIQGRKMEISHAGIEMRILLRDGVIEVGYDNESRTHKGHGSVALIPKTHQQFCLEAYRP